MGRTLILLALLLAVRITSFGADPGPFGQVTIAPSSTRFFVATVSMEFKPFDRQGDAYASTYTARVFPLFYTEKGHIAIIVPDADLLRVARGEAVDFKGRAVNESGDTRRVEGRATPTGPLSGNIRVTVFISKRIVLTYDTTYTLTGAPPAPPVTPRKAR